MTPATIIREAQADGVRLALSPAGTIKATGDGAAVSRWLPIIREHKPGIVDALQKSAKVDAILAQARETLPITTSKLRALLSADDLADIATGDIPPETVTAYAKVFAGRVRQNRDILCIHGTTVAGVLVTTERGHCVSSLSVESPGEEELTQLHARGELRLLRNAKVC